MTTIELRTSIAADLDQMSVEMLESVSRYVRRLRRHARPARRADAIEASPKEIGITPGVARLRTGHPRHITDEELDRLRYESSEFLAVMKKELNHFFAPTEP